MGVKIFLSEKEVEVTDDKSKNNKNFDATGMFRMPARFAQINRLVMRDLNNNQSSPSFYKYTKDQIAEYLKNPYRYQKQLRDAAIYIYGASSHFRRLIQYFTGLSDLSYIISPCGIDTSTAKPTTIGKQFRKTLNLLSLMNIKSQFRKVLTVCLREDTFYGTMLVTNNSITIQQLPSDYCDIEVIEDNVFNVSFNFSYFDTNQKLLDLYPDEFRKKYQIYKSDTVNFKWQELDSPNSFAIKCNDDIANYSLPPFVGIFREVYDLEDYKALKMTKTELENYAMLVMNLGTNKEGDWTMDYEKAKDFYHNLDNVLPEEIGSVLSPMPIDKISFERNSNGDKDTIAEAEQQLYTAAGVSSLLFNNEKASSNALLLSIKADQAITFGIVKSIENAINRFIHSYSYGKNFRVTFLDCSPYNRKEMGDMYLKACQYGLPMVSYYCASQGLSQSEMDCLNFLEDDVLQIKGRFVPLQSSAQQSASSNTDSEAGRPTKDIGDLSDSGELSQETEDGDNN